MSQQSYMARCMSEGRLHSRGMSQGGATHLAVWATAGAVHLGYTRWVWAGKKKREPTRDAKVPGRRHCQCKREDVKDAMLGCPKALPQQAWTGHSALLLFADTVKLKSEKLRSALSTAREGGEGTDHKTYQDPPMLQCDLEPIEPHVLEKSWRSKTAGRSHVLRWHATAHVEGAQNKDSQLPLVALVPKNHLRTAIQSWNLSYWNVLWGSWEMELLQSQAPTHQKIQLSYATGRGVASLHEDATMWGLQHFAEDAQWQLGTIVEHQRLSQDAQNYNGQIKAGGLRPANCPNRSAHCRAIAKHQQWWGEISSCCRCWSWRRLSQREPAGRAWAASGKKLEIGSMDWVEDQWPPPPVRRRNNLAWRSLWCQPSEEAQNWCAWLQANWAEYVWATKLQKVDHLCLSQPSKLKFAVKTSQQQMLLEQCACTRHDIAHH